MGDRADNLFDELMEKNSSEQQTEEDKAFTLDLDEVLKIKQDSYDENIGCIDASDYMMVNRNPDRATIDVALPPFATKENTPQMPLNAELVEEPKKAITDEDYPVIDYSEYESTENDEENMDDMEFGFSFDKSETTPMDNSNDAVLPIDELMALLQDEAQQAEAQETGTQQTETKQIEIPQSEMPQSETPQSETPQSETPQFEFPQFEAQQMETQQTGTSSEDTQPEGLLQETVSEENAPLEIPEPVPDETPQEEKPAVDIKLELPKEATPKKQPEAKSSEATSPFGKKLSGSVMADPQLVQDPFEYTFIKKKKKKYGLFRELLSYAIIIVLAWAAAKLINTYILINAYIPSESMVPTVNIGDRIFGNRLAYINSDPQRGDVVIFAYPDDPSKTYIKRLIGIPGDTVEIIDWVVYITPADGEQFALDDSYINNEAGFEHLRNYGPVTVPNDSYFMLGDNRNHSTDSRFWSNTFVQRDQIYAKAIFRYWPLNRMSIVK